MNVDNNYARKQLGLPEDVNIILFGADDLSNKRKGFQYLLESLSYIKDSSAIILTFGNFAPKLIPEIPQKIINLGNISDDKILSIVYNSADVFVIPSLEDNLPNTVLESFACGTPVVGFNIGGIPDMIEHKKTGYLVQPKNSLELGDAINWVLEHKQMISFSNNCREKAEANYSLTNQADAYFKKYNLILGHNSKPFPNIIKVSTIVSTYNSEKFLLGCLENLVKQTLFNKGELEIVVINSGSEENEEKIVKEFQDSFPNIKYLKTERDTIYEAWNRGIKMSSGKYITNANTDDRHRKDALEILAEELDKNQNIDLVYADQIITKSENETFDEHTATGYFEWPEYDRNQLVHCACFGPQPMWRKSLHKEFGFFNEDFKVAGDYEWWLRISDKVEMKHISEKLGLYLLSDNSVEHNNSENMRNRLPK